MNDKQDTPNTIVGIRILDIADELNIPDGVTHDRNLHNGQEAKKAGILLYHINKETGNLEYLIVSPKPKLEEDIQKGYKVDFLIPRGSRDGTDKDRTINEVDIDTLLLEKEKTVELRDTDAIIKAQNSNRLLPSYFTAVKEAEEELGLQHENIKRMSDMGVWEYHGYGMKVYLAEVNDPEQYARSTKDSDKVTWETLDTIKQMADPANKTEATKDMRSFKEGYLPIVEVAEDYISRNKEISPPSSQHTR